MVDAWPRASRALAALTALGLAGGAPSVSASGRPGPPDEEPPPEPADETKRPRPEADRSERTDAEPPAEQEEAPRPRRRQRRPRAPVEAAPSGPDVRFATEMSGYADTDAVYVATPTLGATVEDPVAGWSLNARYLLDGVSAASVDIVSTASGHWVEKRHVGSAGFDVKAGDVGLSLSGNVSSEPDYLSLGGGGRLSVDTQDKNVTPFLGLSYGRDEVGRTGQPRDTWRSMQRIGTQIGVTFVINPTTIASLSGDGVFERGYLAKPYRYVPVFSSDAAAMLPAGASVADVNRLRLDQRPADALPDARDRWAAAGRIAHRFDGATLRLDERLYWDGWGAAASTSDGRLMADLGRRVLFWPHLRFHAQRAVSFWQRAYVATQAPDGSWGLPRYRSGDRELGGLYTTTFGLGTQVKLGEVRTPWTLSFQFDAIYTRFLDTLYITRRWAGYSALGLEHGF